MFFHILNTKKNKKFVSSEFFFAGKGKKKLLWNEKYFFYGEDLDFCWQLKQHGFSLFFFPGTQTIHYQGVSSGGINQKQKLSAASRVTKVKVAQASTTAMRIFYQENLIHHYPVYLRWIVWLGVDLLEFYRIFKAKYL